VLDEVAQGHDLRRRVHRNDLTKANRLCCHRASPL